MKALKKMSQMKTLNEIRNAGIEAIAEAMVK
jgi:hypothetical protein